MYALTNIGMAELDAGLEPGTKKLVRALSVARSTRPGGATSAASFAAAGHLSGRANTPIRSGRQATSRPGLTYCDRARSRRSAGFLSARPPRRAQLDPRRLGRGRRSRPTGPADPGCPRVAAVPLPCAACRPARRPGRERRRSRRRMPAGRGGRSNRRGSARSRCPRRARLAQPATNATVQTRHRAGRSTLALEPSRPSWIAGELAYWRWQAGLRDELLG